LQVPSKILWPSAVFSQISPAKLAVMEEFVMDMEKAFGMTRTPFDFASAWEKYCPIQPFKTVGDYMNKVCYPYQAEAILAMCFPFNLHRHWLTSNSTMRTITLKSFAKTTRSPADMKLTPILLFVTNGTWPD
jgi:hypothetical protein